MLSYPAYTALLLFAAGVLVFLNASFVAAEFSIVKVRKTRLEELVKQGNRNARVALKCSNNLFLHPVVDAARGHAREPWPRLDRRKRIRERADPRLSRSVSRRRAPVGISRLRLSRSS